MLLVKQTCGQHLDATLTFIQPSSALAKKVGSQQIKANVGPLPRPRPRDPQRGRRRGLPHPRRPAGPRRLDHAGAVPQPGAAARAGEQLRPRHHAVVVSLGADPDEQSYVVAYTLNLQVEGKKGGAPTYDAAEPAPPAPSPTPSPEPAEPGASDSDGGGSPWVWIGGLLVVAAGAAAALLLLRRRRR